MIMRGDPDGLTALRVLQERNRDYLKFLMQEAKTVFEHHVDFKSETGVWFRLTFEMKTGAFTVDKKPD